MEVHTLKRLWVSKFITRGGAGRLIAMCACVHERILVRGSGGRLIAVCACVHERILVRGSGGRPIAMCMSGYGFGLLPGLLRA